MLVVCRNTKRKEIRGIMMVKLLGILEGLKGILRWKILNVWAAILLILS